MQTEGGACPCAATAGTGAGVQVPRPACCSFHSKVRGSGVSAETMNLDSGGRSQILAPLPCPLMSFIKERKILAPVSPSGFED